jgi:Zn-dependent M28 family amino/carboxypeptidase
MRKSIIAVVILVAASGAYLTARTQRQEKAAGAISASAIDPEKIRAHVKFLSSDLLEGRGMGQRGSDIAAEYIATQFALDGLKPAGDQGTYFQEVPMVKITTLPDTTMSLVPKSGEPLQLKNLDDFVIHNETQTDVADIDAPIVFVGYGITAPEYKWDDYKGVDLKGKVALLFVNEPTSDDPKFFKGKALTYYGRWTYKYEETARHGAVATLIKAHVVSTVSPFNSRNVLAMLPGSDPARRDETVMYTAHYDHLGIDTSAKGDNIYNGAVDNGTGCGIILELARAWARAQQAPPRSILFAAVTAEEQGLLGSEFLGKHFATPVGKVTLDLNYDAVAPIADPEEIEITGAERTTFYPQVEKTAQKYGLAIRPDPQPEAGHYYRSDHFSLARVGIPSFSISEGVKFKGHDEAWGRAQAKDYVEHHYHQPSDEYRPEMDFTGLAKVTQFGYDLGLQAASQPALVQWQSGDEFESARKKAGN